MMRNHLLKRNETPSKIRYYFKMSYKIQFPSATGKKKSHCEVTGAAHSRDAHHTLKLASDTQKYCSIISFYESSTYYFLGLGKGLSESPIIEANKIVKCRFLILLN